MSSVTIKSVDRGKVRQAVYTYAARLRQEHPEVDRVIWFGSWVNGLPSPGSDVDLCLILASSDKARRDRISDYLPMGFPVGLDLCIYTRCEFEQLPHNSPGWYPAITSGIDV